MDLYTALVQIATLLLSEDDPERTTEVVFQRVLELSGAERGFLVVREGDSFERKLNFHYDLGEIRQEERLFSRSLVKRAIETKEIISSQNLLEDARFSGTESVEHVGPCSVLVVPLHHGGEVYAVIYLDQRLPRGGFPDDVVRFMGDFAQLAAQFIRRGLERDALRRRNAALEHDLFAQHDFEGIVTRDPKMLRLLELVAQVAESDATVLIGGETGTGKELVARALHVNSRRKAKPFVVIHCTALPASVLESELFGHVKGAFTGAERERVGRIASAHGGTLVLDEVAEIPLDCQAKLLRFLQFGEIQRVGSDRTEKVDVRVVSATHQDLRGLVERGRFRQDLYFRLNVIELVLPALRERRGDLPLLADALLRRHWRRGGEARFTARAMDALGRHTFPGNVRELEHVVERACVLSRSPDLDVDLLPPELLPASAAAPLPESTAELTSEALERAREAAVTAAEHDFVSRLLRRCEGNVSRAARESGIHRTYLQRLVSKHQLRQS